MSAELGGAWPVALDVVRVVIVLGAGLLVPAGVAKLRRPRTTADALAWRGTHATSLVRVVGAGEVSLAAAVLVLGTRPLLAGLALVYGAFAVVAARQRRRGGACGCFGQASAPTSLLHVGLNALVAVAAALAAAGPGALAHLEAPARLGFAPGHTVLAAVLAVVGVASVQQLLTGLPELRAATRRVTLPAPRAARTDAAVQGDAR
ncbi:MauE/DoxX family redox-associated membrane protein [Egicoccus sp. AB-alg2]|uniref:MauE/DoxX family redox-associated membrane protein n=1 Tax=Egicoccus sp. AB-alg2 TaxID=3242693 RepID=UPI00359D2010